MSVWESLSHQELASYPFKYKTSLESPQCNKLQQRWRTADRKTTVRAVEWSQNNPWKSRFNRKRSKYYCANILLYLRASVCLLQRLVYVCVPVCVFALLSQCNKSLCNTNKSIFVIPFDLIDYSYRPGNDVWGMCVCLHINNALADCYVWLCSRMYCYFECIYSTQLSCNSIIYELWWNEAPTVA